MLHGICELGCLHAGLIVELVTGLPLLQHRLHRGSELVDLQESGNPDLAFLRQPLSLFTLKESIIVLNLGISMESTGDLH